MIQLSLIDYFWLRQRIPIFVYFFYIYFKKSDNPRVSFLLKIFILFSGLTTIYFTMGYILKIPFEKIISLKWHYSGLITWGLFFIIYYLIILKKNYSSLNAFALAMIATTGAGWLYEMPFNSKMSFIISLNTVFLIDGQILCLLLLGYELKKMSFQPTFYIFAAFIVYVVFSIFIHKDFWGLWRIVNMLPGSKYLFQWIYRIPTCLFLISLTDGLQGNGCEILSLEP